MAPAGGSFVCCHARKESPPRRDHKLPRRFSSGWPFGGQTLQFWNQTLILAILR